MGFVSFQQANTIRFGGPMRLVAVPPGAAAAADGDEIVDAPARTARSSSSRSWAKKSSCISMMSVAKA